MKRPIIFNGIFLLKIMVCSMFVYYPLFGQFPRLNFKSFTEKDGLSKDYVRSICQDRDGFMWFGTPDGLDKFDGKNFINYNDLLKDTLAGNYQISYDILEDRNGIIWIATYSNGIILFDKYREKITRLKHDINDSTSLGNDKVFDVFEDKKENIWVATAGGGLDLWKNDSKGFVHYRNNPDDPNSIASNYISSIAEDSKGNLWILTIDGFICKLDQETGIFENRILPLKSHSVTFHRGDHQIVYIDSDDNVIIGSFYGLYIIYGQNGSLKHLPKLDPRFNVNFLVTSILEIQKGIIAITTTFQGLYLLNIETGTYVNYSSSKYADFFLNNSSVTSIYKSKNGLIWLGSYHAGINMYDKAFSQFQLLIEEVDSGKELLSGNRGAAFCISPDNKIWIASGEKGIIAYDPIENTAKRVLENVCQSAINCLYSNNYGEVLIGTEADGLIIYDFLKEKYTVLKNNPKSTNSIASNSIYRVVQDDNNKVWIGYTGTGLDMWDRSANKITHFKYEEDNPNSLISNSIYKLLNDRNGKIWVGTQHGLCHYNPEKNNFIRHPLYFDSENNLEVNTIIDIFEDSDGGIWVGTDKAIFKLNTDDKTSEMLSPENESPYLITNFMEDRDGNVWMTSFNKLFKWDSDNHGFSVYNFYNGNSTPSFLGFSSLVSPDRFYLGSLDRIIVFDPMAIREDKMSPEIFITQLEINNTPVKINSFDVLSENINFTKNLKLDHRHSTFTFVFAALEYSFPEKIQYAYKLENFDNDWVYPGNMNNRAVYTKVPPGKYVFHVMATNKQGDWFESDQKIKITIKPPLWRFPGYQIFLLLCVFGIVYGIFSFRSKNLKDQKKKLEETVRQRTKDLNDANASLAEQHEEVKQQNDLLSQMSQEILKQNKKLEMHYTELERLVDERTKELKEAKNKAEESDRLKSAFLANMSHEIRTPMNAIVGFVNLLRDGDLNEEERNNSIEIINSNADSLLVLIDDILDLSMIEANQLVIRNEIININELLDHMYSAYSVLNRNENLKLIINNVLHNRNLKIYADKARIKQILSNLLSNALKFTKQGFVELGAITKQKGLAFYVKDTGIGIKEDDFESIFERFSKSEGKDKFFRGAGLGLSISKALAMKMGGELTVESSMGIGSVFTLLLPDSLVTNMEPEVKDVQITLNNETREEKNVLIVEDEHANYLYLKNVLAKTKIKIFHVENGLEALKILESEVFFHLILMDIKMPEMDGFKATQMIKSKNPSQIVIAVTAFAHPEEKHRFLKAGFDDYLTKPVRPNELRDVINKYL